MRIRTAVPEYGPLMRPDEAAADVEKIQRLCDRFVAAFREKDVERTLSVFAPRGSN